MIIDQPPRQFTSRFGLLVLVLRPDGTAHRLADFTPPMGGVPLTAMTFNDDGDLLVAYDNESAPGGPTNHHFEARLFTSANQLAPVQPVADVPAGDASLGRPILSAALAADRRAVLGWNTLPCDSFGCQTATLGIAIARPGMRFGAARTLPRVRGNSWSDRPGPVLVSTAEPGGFTVAWNARDHTRLVLMRAEVRADQLVRRRRVSSRAAHAHAAALVSGPRGATALLWREGATAEAAIFAPSRLMATVSPPGRRFGPPEIITRHLRPIPDPERGQLFLETPVSAAIDPSAAAG